MGVRDVLFSVESVRCRDSTIHYYFSFPVTEVRYSQDDRQLDSVF